MFWRRFFGVWKDPALRVRVLLIALVVGGLVTAAHLFLDARVAASGWFLFHVSVPVIVFASGALAAGVRRPSRALVVRGVLTVATVTVAFTVINGRLELAPWASLLLNSLVPATVSSLGAMGGSA